MSLRNISSPPIINISKNLTADRLTIELTIVNLERNDHVIWIFRFLAKDFWSIDQFHFMYVSILSFDHLSFFSPNWWIIYFSIISIYFCLFHDWPFDHIFFLFVIPTYFKVEYIRGLSWSLFFQKRIKVFRLFLIVY